MPQLFDAGEAVLICGELPRMKGVVKWSQPHLCKEHGDPVYRIGFNWPDGGGYCEGDFCESVLARPNAQ